MYICVCVCVYGLRSPGLQLIGKKRRGLNERGVHPNKGVSLLHYTLHVLNEGIVATQYNNLITNMKKYR